MNPKKQANLRRSVVIKVLVIYLAVALLVLFISSFIGFYLGGPEGATFALGIGLLINLLAFPVVGLRLTARLRVMADEEAGSAATILSTPQQPVKAQPIIRTEEPTPPAEKPSA
jgi:hypothetical protein